MKIGDIIRMPTEAPWLTLDEAKGGYELRCGNCGLQEAVLVGAQESARQLGQFAAVHRHCPTPADPEGTEP